MGDGAGKWQLAVESSRPVVVMKSIGEPDRPSDESVDGTEPHTAWFANSPHDRGDTGADHPLGEPVTVDFGRNADLTHALEGADRVSFQIDRSSGQLSSRAEATYDFETQAGYEMMVRVTEALGGMARVPVVVEVTDVNEPPARPDAPEVEGVSSRSVMVRWDEPENTGPAIDDYDVEYRREGASEYTDANYDGVDREAEVEYLRQRADYEFRVRASNAEGTGEWSEPTLGRARTGGGGGGGGGGTTPPPPQNSPPAFDEGRTATREFAVNTPAGLKIGAPISATDNDRDTLAYSLGGADAASFDIDPNTGQLQDQGGRRLRLRCEPELRGDRNGRRRAGRQCDDRGGAHGYSSFPAHTERRNDRKRQQGQHCGKGGGVRDFGRHRIRGRCIRRRSGGVVHADDDLAADKPGELVGERAGRRGIRHGIERQRDGVGLEIRPHGPGRRDGHADGRPHGHRPRQITQRPPSSRLTHRWQR